MDQRRGILSRGDAPISEAQALANRARERRIAFERATSPEVIRDRSNPGYAQFWKERAALLAIEHEHGGDDGSVGAAIASVRSRGDGWLSREVSRQGERDARIEREGIGNTLRGRRY